MPDKAKLESTGFYRSQSEITLCTLIILTRYLIIAVKCQKDMLYNFNKNTTWHTWIQQHNKVISLPCLACSYQFDTPMIAAHRLEKASKLPAKFKKGKCVIITPTRSFLSKHSTFSSLPVAPWPSILQDLWPDTPWSNHILTMLNYRPIINYFHMMI